VHPEHVPMDLSTRLQKETVMKKMLASGLIVLALLVGLPKAFALSELILVTKANQAKLGVQFTLSAIKVSDTAVMVEMEIPKQSKLKDLKKVTMDIGDYKAGVLTSPMVSASLRRSPVRTVRFWCRSKCLRRWRISALYF
jgi:hypothetical protein